MPERAWGPFYVGSIYDLGTKNPIDFRKVGLFLCYAKGNLIDIIRTRSFLNIIQKRSR